MTNVRFQRIFDRASVCGLGFLPRKLCLQKLKLITKVAKSFIN